MSRLPPNPDAKAREWLLHGYKKYHGRAEGAEYMNDSNFFSDRLSHRPSLTHCDVAFSVQYVIKAFNS